MLKKPRNYSPSRVEKALFNVSKGISKKTGLKKYGVSRTTLKMKYDGLYKKNRMG